MNESARVHALDMTHANPPLLAALAMAQTQAQTVGKDGTNTQKHYKYATAEAMIRASRDAMSGTGLSVLSTWTVDASDPPEGDIGFQFSCGTVIESFVLAHAEGGYITGRAECDAIASKGRPYDKAVTASATYMHGFVLRHLLNLDRAEEGEHAVDRRSDEGFEPRRPNGRPAKSEPAWDPKIAEAQTRLRESTEAYKKFREEHSFDKVAPVELYERHLLTRRFDGGRGLTAEDWLSLDRFVRQETRGLMEQVERDRAEASEERKAISEEGSAANA